ncbi:hypothetical protein D3C81_2060130 [compost metagenome]
MRDMLLPFLPIFCRSTRVQDKRLAQHQLRLGQHLTGFFKHMAVSPFETVGYTARLSLNRSPDVIDANQNAEHIRLQIDGILVPAGK